MKEFDEYQKTIEGFMNPEVMKKESDIFENGLLGLAGEVGELIDMVKKWKFHGHDMDWEKAFKELGDIQFYVALTARGMSQKLSDIAQMNVDKLNKRYEGGNWTVEKSKAKVDQL